MPKPARITLSADARDAAVAHLRRIESPGERAMVCYLMARAYLIEAMHLEGPRTAGEESYRLADEVAGVLK